MIQRAGEWFTQAQNNLGKATSLRENGHRDAWLIVGSDLELVIVLSSNHP